MFFYFKGHLCQLVLTVQLISVGEVGHIIIGGLCKREQCLIVLFPQ